MPAVTVPTLETPKDENTEKNTTKAANAEQRDNQLTKTKKERKPLKEKSA
jgi:hypothetical protein